MTKNSIWIKQASNLKKSMPLPWNEDPFANIKCFWPAKNRDWSNYLTPKSPNYIAVSLFTGQCKYKTQRLAGLPALWLLVEHKQTLYPCAKRKGLALRDFWLCSGSSRLLSGFASDRAESTAAPAFWQIVYVVERFEMLGDIRVGMTATKSAMFSFGLWCPSNGFNPIFK